MVQPKVKLEKFSWWVAATAVLFEDQLAEPVSETALHFLMQSMVQRKRVLDMRASRDWALASYYEAEAQTSKLVALFYVGLNSFFGDTEFDMAEFRYVRKHLESPRG